MKILNYALHKTPEYQTLLSALENGRVPIMATGLSRVHKVNIIDTLPDDTGSRRALVVVSDDGEAQRVAQDLESLGRKAEIFPSRDLVFRSVEGVSHEFEQNRIGVLTRLIAESCDTVVASVDAIMTKTLPQHVLAGLMLTVKAGDTLNISELAKRLVQSGYVRCSMVDGAGQFSIRGGIVDIFIPSRQLPVRIEFWDDEIDTVSEFDIVSQRKTAQLESCDIAPAREVLFSNNADFAKRITEFAEKLTKKNETAKQNCFKDADILNSGITISNIDKYLPLCYSACETLLDYMCDAIVFIADPTKVAERIRTFSWQYNEDTKVLVEDGILCRGLEGYTLSSTEIYSALESLDTVILETFSATGNKIKPKELVSFSLRTIAPWGGLVAELAADIKPLVTDNYGIAVLAGSERAAMGLVSSLADEGITAVYHNGIDKIEPQNVVVMQGGMSGGVDFVDAKIAVFTHARQNAAKTKRKKHYTHQGAALGSLEELKSGELVVHSVYGIGVFEGIHKIENSGVTKDYIKIKFQHDDILYVPVTQLDLVSRYVGAGDSTTVKLNKLGSDAWMKTKKRVKSAVRDMAKELIKLYATRMNAKGYAFSEDNDLQHDFEFHFPYDETDDQLRSIDEIKGDMQRSVPMERLLCGDVGFGKTEVALRAAFKCVCDGKQCAILVPTTILAWQHFQTLLKRLEHFPVNCEMLSRFRNASQQNKIKKQITRGEVDIVVGTHKLISNDVKFRDLGLLIIDEEQRFGVAQKEKLKQSFPNVDVLTLSATPIPRTLNMAMSGLRDMSVLEEAPHDRHPVQTYVLEHDYGVVNDAVRKELARGGQVYYIYNRVETIGRVAARLKEAIPSANISVAHGQMSEEELSGVWRGLIDHEIDVLVSTTIIETGVDVPNVNTLIIEDADRFGLSQLHQLRGRVGRSSRRAYAYMTFRRGKLLSDIATKRLEAIREFTEFGSGFKIAMRDLEIRGAGNILGASQHGHMESVGYDMYLKLLNDAVCEEKGEKVEQTDECVVDLQVAAHIPEKYIESLSARLQIYRRIAQIKTDADSEDVMDELIDRFGEPPKAVLGLIDIALLRNRAASLGITEITDKTGSMLVYFEQFDFERASMLTAATMLKGRVLISAGDKPYVAVRARKGQQPIDTMREILNALEEPIK